MRDSPGASIRSTASIAGCTSNVGRGTSGSTSSSVPPLIKPSPTPFCCPFAVPDDTDDTDDVRDRPGAHDWEEGKGVGGAE